MSEHDLDPHAMVGAYVADALDDGERATFERHLVDCGSCRREVAEFAEATAELSWLTETPPPPALRDALLTEIATVRPLPPEEPVGSSTTAREPATAVLPVPDELALRRQRRTRRVLLGLVAAALVLVVGLTGWVAALRGAQQNQQVASQQVNELLTAPDATVYATTLNGAPVSFVVSQQRDQALFVADDLAGPGDGKVYQLWMIGDEITPNALIEQGGDVAHWFDAGPLDSAKRLAVTIEPAGGSTAPSLPPVAGVEL